MELKLQIHGSDQCYSVAYEPDTGIEEVWIESWDSKHTVILDTAGLFVAQGQFPDIKTVPLMEELDRLAEIEFAENRAEWLEMKREEAAEYKREAYD